MRAVRHMPRANQNTNGAVEAWHRTMKRMLRRKIGGIQGFRLDRILQFLFEEVLPYFWYQMQCKESGMVTNIKKEEIVLNSLHLAMHSMSDSQVSFVPNSHPLRAFVTSCQAHDKKYEVYNVGSNFPTCSCPWAEEGNMCKHQLKCLLLKGWDPGFLVQQLGSLDGSEFGGICHLPYSPVPPELRIRVSFFFDALY